MIDNKQWKHKPTTVSGNTHYYQTDTFTGDNVFDNKIKIELKSQEELGKIIVEQVVKIHDLEYQLQAKQDKEDKLREYFNSERFTTVFLTFTNAKDTIKLDIEKILDGSDYK